MIIKEMNIVFTIDKRLRQEKYYNLSSQILDL